MNASSTPAHLLEGLTTPHVADALLRLGLPVRCAPATVRPLQPGTRVAGRVRPARHAGSVDVFLEALEQSAPGEVLVVDNGGRRGEACVGDLTALEVQGAGLAGMVVWGLHRDTSELHAIGLPVFSEGALPTGPLRLDPQHPDALRSARVGDHTVSPDDVVLGDDDGIVFLPLDRVVEVAERAREIRDTERRQAELVASGVSLRHQLHFGEYLRARAASGTTFREHLRSLGGALEE
ncbi:RraA family protein [Herbiconiux moechotypicola]|uniref:Putative 4-hydroxy-4-methyl-2-oxoglutarate aldolase n=1 Tax=Herbiconiux moechotypicola TaxID=637393 RepID=A0ABN3E5F6_9MICO|nr:RraA family protein [Herbiconiux moechotypicola]MCS5731781.1 RraA family protein [Herbiconiux moechotypicola]